MLHDISPLSLGSPTPLTILVDSGGKVVKFFVFWGDPQNSKPHPGGDEGVLASQVAVHHQLILGGGFSPKNIGCLTCKVGPKVTGVT